MTILTLKVLYSEVDPSKIRFIDRTSLKREARKVFRMIDDNQKRFIPHLAIDNDFFHSAFVNPCMM